MVKKRISPPRDIISISTKPSIEVASRRYEIEQGAIDESGRLNKFSRAAIRWRNSGKKMKILENLCTLSFSPPVPIRITFLDKVYTAIFLAAVAVERKKPRTVFWGEMYDWLRYICINYMRNFNAIFWLGFPFLFSTKTDAIDASNGAFLCTVDLGAAFCVSFVQIGFELKNG